MATARPLRADAQRNRDRLLDAATAAFADEGEKVALETIAARAGVGIGTLYRHFPDRSALIVEAYRHEVEQLCSSADGLLANLPADKALHEWMDRFAQYAATGGGMGDALRSAVASDSPMFADTRARLVATLRSFTEAGATSGVLRRDADPEDVCGSWARVWHLPMEPGWQDDVRRILSLLVDGLRYGTAG